MDCLDVLLEMAIVAYLVWTWRLHRRDRHRALCLPWRE